MLLLIERTYLWSFDDVVFLRVIFKHDEISVVPGPVGNGINNLLVVFKRTFWRNGNIGMGIWEWMEYRNGTWEWMEYRN